MKKIRILKSFRYIQHSREQYYAVTFFYGTHTVSEKCAEYAVSTGAAEIVRDAYIFGMTA